MVSLNNIRPGSVVVVRPNFGLDDPIEVIVSEVDENIKNNFPGIVYGMNWAYLDQVDYIISF